MPYDLAFKRIIQLDNESALQANKLLASSLIANFSEIYDLNAANPSAHFAQVEIDSEDEFPERHFRLEADVNEMHFSYEFWKDVLWIELGAAGTPTVRFAHVRKYAELIMQQGFAMTSIANDEILTLDKGLDEHLAGYQEWVGFVDYVTKVIAAQPSSTE